MTKEGGKGCLVPIRLSDLYFPKTILHIKLTKDYYSTKPIDLVLFVGDRIPNPFLDFVKGLLVDD